MPISAASDAVGATKIARASNPIINSPDIIIPLDRSNRPWSDDRSCGMVPLRFAVGNELCRTSGLSRLMILNIWNHSSLFMEFPQTRICGTYRSPHLNAHFPSNRFRSDSFEERSPLVRKDVFPSPSAQHFSAIPLTPSRVRGWPHCSEISFHRLCGNCATKIAAFLYHYDKTTSYRYLKAPKRALLSFPDR